MGWWSWALTAVSVVGLWGTAGGRRWGWALNLTGQPLWLAYAISTRQLGFVASALAFSLVFTRNLVLAHRARAGLAGPHHRVQATSDRRGAAAGPSPCCQTPGLPRRAPRGGCEAPLGPGRPACAVAGPAAHRASCEGAPPVEAHPMVNKVILVGPLARDAESCVGARGPVTRMRMRTARSWQDADGTPRTSTEYHNVVAFDRHAELCALYGFKDVTLYIEGRLRTREYEGGDGLRRTTTDIVVEVVRVLGARDATTDAASAAHREPAAATAAEG